MYRNLSLIPTSDEILLPQRSDRNSDHHGNDEECRCDLGASCRYDCLLNSPKAQNSLTTVSVKY